MKQETSIITTLALDNWKMQILRATKLFETLTDEQLEKEVAPNRNTGIYLLGHLTAIHDAMLSLLEIGERLHPELDDIFIKNPDKSGLPKPPLTYLRNYWKQVNDVLDISLSSITSEGWLTKHSLISEEDFFKNPSRNKLNILLSRTNHVAYHLGQLTFLKG
jgi:hypothetical protein